MKSTGSRGPNSDAGIKLELTPSTELTISIIESPRARIKRVMSENPVIIFARPSCYMCHVMRSLLSAVGARPPTVIELVDEDAVFAAGRVCGGNFASPALCIGGACVGGLESTVGLHLSNGLVPRLADAGAIKKKENDK